MAYTSWALIILVVEQKKKKTIQNYKKIRMFTNDIRLTTSRINSALISESFFQMTRLIADTYLFFLLN